MDPKPFRIHKVLGDGQYELTRDNNCNGLVYRQEDLRTEP